MHATTKDMNTILHLKHHISRGKILTRVVASPTGPGPKYCAQQQCLHFTQRQCDCTTYGTDEVTLAFEIVTVRRLRRVIHHSNSDDISSHISGHATERPTVVKTAAIVLINVAPVLES
jgi:hypothetical protein